MLLFLNRGGGLVSILLQIQKKLDFSSINNDISVSVAVFDDLNLKNLLNTVGAAQSNYENAVKKRATIEGDMSVKLKAAEETRTNDLFVIEFEPVQVLGITRDFPVHSPMVMPRIHL